MHRHPKLLGCLLAGFTVLVWGSTFVSSKHLLGTYAPAQIMLVRLSIAYCALWLIYPHHPHLTRRQWGLFFLLGLFGSTLYFYTENTAMTYTLASNVGIMGATAPIFTAILAHICGTSRIRSHMILGFLIAFSGIILVVCNGTFVLKLNPRGDILALLSPVCWAVYSLLLEKMNGTFDPIPVTRLTILWGILTTLPLAWMEPHPFSISALANPSIWGNFLFLGLVGSAVCFVLWNHAVRLLGVVTANTFIYVQPFVTMVVANLFLDEPISPLAAVGAILITIGVVLSQREPGSARIKAAQNAE